MEALTPSDVTDDRLADVLRVLSDDERYRACEQEVMGHLLRVYALDARLRAAGHDHGEQLRQRERRRVAAIGTFQRSSTGSAAREHGPGHPGPMWRSVGQRLDVGDCNMAAEKTRAHLQALGYVSLCPLSALPVPPATLAQHVEARLSAGSPLIQVVCEVEAGQPTCIAQGEETLVDMEVADQERMICGLERRLIIPSIDGSKAAQSRVQERLEKAEKAIRELMVRSSVSRKTVVSSPDLEFPGACRASPGGHRACQDTAWLAGLRDQSADRCSGTGRGGGSVSRCIPGRAQRWPTHRPSPVSVTAGCPAG